MFPCPEVDFQRPTEIAFLFILPQQSSTEGAGKKARSHIGSGVWAKTEDEFVPKILQTTRE